MNSSRKLYTFGYEGLALDAFLARLSSVGVRIVADVRELPLSRKRGFSKNALAAALQAHDIAYIHMPALGCPKVVRDKYRADGDWEGYTRRFLSYLKTQETSVLELAKLACADKCCLLCFEADFNYCHRTMVARAATVIGAPAVVHITAQKVIPDQAHRAAA